MKMTSSPKHSDILAPVTPFYWEIPQLSLFEMLSIDSFIIDDLCKPR